MAEASNSRDGSADQQQALLQKSHATGSTITVDEDLDKLPTLYLNILVAKKTKEMDKMIQEKLNEKIGNKLPFKFLGNAAGRVASKMVTTDKIAASMAKKFPEVLPQKMSEMGIEAHAEEVFAKGSFIVIRIQVVHVDVEALLKKTMGEGQQDKVDSGLKCLRCVARCFGQEHLLEEKMDSTMSQKIVQGLCQKLPETLPEKMADKGLICEVVAKSAEEQAAYFFEALRHLDDHHAPEEKSTSATSSAANANAAATGKEPVAEAESEHKPKPRRFFRAFRSSNAKAS